MADPFAPFKQSTGFHITSTATRGAINGAARGLMIGLAAGVALILLPSIFSVGLFATLGASLNLFYVLGVGAAFATAGAAIGTVSGGKAAQDEVRDIKLGIVDVSDSPRLQHLERGIVRSQAQLGKTIKPPHNTPLVADETAAPPAPPAPATEEREAPPSREATTRNGVQIYNENHSDPYSHPHSAHHPLNDEYRDEARTDYHNRNGRQEPTSSFDRDAAPRQHPRRGQETSDYRYDRAEMRDFRGDSYAPTSGSHREREMDRRSEYDYPRDSYTQGQHPQERYADTRGGRPPHSHERPFHERIPQRSPHNPDRDRNPHDPRNQRFASEASFGERLHQRDYNDGYSSGFKR